MIAIDEIQNVFVQYDYPVPQDRDDLDDLVQSLEENTDDQTEEFVDQFIDTYHIIKYRLENGTYRQARPPTFQELVLMQEV